MSEPGERTKKLILHVEVPEYYADDIPEGVLLWEGTPDNPRDVANYLAEEIRSDVGLTVVTIPGDKCMNDDFGVFATTGRIVGAQVVDIATNLRRQHPAPLDGVGLIAAERHRQITVEDWTPEHDDAHVHGELAAAAVCYAMHADPDGAGENAVDFWPWDREWWKPDYEDPIRDLVRAGALIAAEIDRRNREAQS